MDYSEMLYQEAQKRAVKVLEDGYGDAVVLKDDHGYWVLYYLYGFQVPPPEALPHWMDGPFPGEEGIRSPYEMQKFLEQQGDFTYLNDVD